MKLVPLFAAMAVLLGSCQTHTTSAPSGYEGEVTPVDSIDEDWMARISIHFSPDGIALESLSDSVDYLVLPSDFPRTAEIDSLVEFYNICAAANALQADMYLQTRGLIPSENMPVFNCSGVTNPKYQKLLNDLSEAIHTPYKESEDEAFWNRVDGCFDTLSAASDKDFIKYFEAKTDKAKVSDAMDESNYIADYKTFKEDIDSAKITAAQLKKLCLKEKYFVPQTVLVRDYARVCYAAGDTLNCKIDYVALIESQLNTGIYSPYLPELWRMWRCSLQLDRSISNDGEILNHYYNAMRNKVAMTILREYVKTKSSDALRNFVVMAVNYNIIRRGTLIGNYATLEDMDLFWYPTEALRGCTKRAEGK